MSGLLRNPAAYLGSVSGLPAGFLIARGLWFLAPLPVLVGLALITWSHSYARHAWKRRRAERRIWRNIGVPNPRAGWTQEQHDRFTSLWVGYIEMQRRKGLA
jgi:hypothetical protein